MGAGAAQGRTVRRQRYGLRAVPRQVSAQSTAGGGDVLAGGERVPPGDGGGEVAGEGGAGEATAAAGGDAVPGGGGKVPRERAGVGGAVRVRDGALPAGAV